MARKTKKDIVNKIEQSTEEINAPTLDINVESDLNEEESEILPQESILVNEQEITIEPIKPKRTIESLSRDEFRMYQRTGRLPE